MQTKLPSLLRASARIITSPCKPREKFTTNEPILLNFSSSMPALNTVSDITVRAKGSQPTTRVSRMQIRVYLENAQRAINPAPEPKKPTKKPLLAAQKNTPTHTLKLCLTDVTICSPLNSN